MSAFVVGKEHINAVITGGLSVQHKPMHYYHNGQAHQLDDLTADRVGQMLLDENVKSVMYRYEDSPITDLPGKVNAEWLIPFEYHPMAGDSMTALWVISITRCLMYQSCEHPEWEESEAKRFCETLIYMKISQLPGYEDAPWEWTKPIHPTNPIRLA